MGCIQKIAILALDDNNCISSRCVRRRDRYLFIHSRYKMNQEEILARLEDIYIKKDWKLMLELLEELRSGK